jgi:hypothetical protein
VKVVCLNWRDYLGMGDLYVSTLKGMVAEHLTLPYEFVEVTEHDLPEGREGWFCKLHLLEMFDGPVLYLDLDVVINSNIDHLVEIAAQDPSRIWARNDFSYPVSANSRVVGDGYAGPLMANGRESTINSSVMLWHGRKDMAGVDQMIPHFHGDQGIITRLFWPDGIGLLPESSVKSYKYHGEGQGAITVYHGSPKPHEVAW